MKKDNKLKLIDFFKPEGINNKIALYYGDKDLHNYQGEKWDITPYEDIAGMVNMTHVKHKNTYTLENNVAFQPVNDYSKNDLMNGKTPCLIIVPKRVFIKDYGFDIDKTSVEKRPWPLYNLLLGHKDSVRIYFEESLDEINEKLESIFPL